MSLDEFRNTLMLRVYAREANRIQTQQWIDDEARKSRLLRQKKLDAQKQQELEEEDEKRARELEERRIIARARVRLAAEEEVRNAKLAEDEEQRLRDEKQRNDQFNRDFLALAKVFQGQSEFPSKAKWDYDQSKLFNDQNLFFAKKAKEMETGTTTPLTKEEIEMMDKIGALVGKSLITDFAQLELWARNQYKAARAEYFRNILKDSDSLLRFWASRL